METYKYDLLKMRHARLVAEIAMYASRANRESVLGGWMCDWGEAMSASAREAESIEREIDAAFNSANVWRQRPRTVGATGAGSEATKHLA